MNLESGTMACVNKDRVDGLDTKHLRVLIEMCREPMTIIITGISGLIFAMTNCRREVQFNLIVISQ